MSEIVALFMNHDNIPPMRTQVAYAAVRTSMADHAGA